MLLVLFLFLRVPGCLVFLKQFPMLLYDVSDGIAAHVYPTLWWSHLSMSWLLFNLHHSLRRIFFPHPAKTKNWREDLHVVVCPLVCYWAYYPLKLPLNISAASRYKFCASFVAVKVKVLWFFS